MPHVLLQAEYKRDYRKAYFGLTRKKEGWDCMRHYEILGESGIMGSGGFGRQWPSSNTHTHASLNLDGDM
jgi:hypothetical protein